MKRQTRTDNNLLLFFGFLKIITAKDSSRFSYYRHRDNGERKKGKKGFRSISETPVLLYNFYIFIFCTTNFFF